ncbi:hypothetical protein EG329_011974 [Mollisiaceae sp. DMI_Dod_QoI]|nr:hypothetical protein EG329_011974 [Helotiales sp. DMI_Dod_QoI]
MWAQFFNECGDPIYHSTIAKELGEDINKLVAEALGRYRESRTSEDLERIIGKTISTNTGQFQPKIKSEPAESSYASHAIPPKSTTNSGTFLEEFVWSLDILNNFTIIH